MRYASADSGTETSGSVTDCDSEASCEDRVRALTQCEECSLSQQAFIDPSSKWLAELLADKACSCVAARTYNIRHRHSQSPTRRTLALLSWPTCLRCLTQAGTVSNQEESSSAYLSHVPKMFDTDRYSLQPGGLCLPDLLCLSLTRAGTVSNQAGPVSDLCLPDRHA